MSVPDLVPEILATNTVSGKRFVQDDDLKRRDNGKSGRSRRRTVSVEVAPGGVGKQAEKMLMYLVEQLVDCRSESLSGPVLDARMNHGHRDIFGVMWL